MTILQRHAVRTYFLEMESALVLQNAMSPSKMSLQRRGIMKSRPVNILDTQRSGNESQFERPDGLWM